MFSFCLSLVGCPTEFVLSISTNDLLLLKLNSSSHSETLKHLQDSVLEELTLHRWQGVMWSLSLAPPDDLVGTTGLCCLLGWGLWPQDRSLQINKVETSSLLKGERLVVPSVPLESHVSRTWIWPASEDGGFQALPYPSLIKKMADRLA